ncbi:MAG: hypothetical protein Q9225_007641, partial [Loekoesia sp. 1 TL-2023]
MAPPTSGKRKHELITKAKTQRPIKKFKKQTHYSSPSSSLASADETSDFPAVNLAGSASEPDAEDNNLSDHNVRLRSTNERPLSASSASPSASDSGDSSSTSDTSSLTASKSDSKRKAPKPTSKRNDPSAFASSISSILTSKLSNPKRSDPVLARSSSAQEANTALREAQLEKRARQQLRAEKKQLLEKGRVKDVLLGTEIGVAEGEEMSAAQIMEEERKLKKTAQRGVVKLFNAVRMAQVRAEEARKEA